MKLNNHILGLIAMLLLLVSCQNNQSTPSENKKCIQKGVLILYRGIPEFGIIPFTDLFAICNVKNISELSKLDTIFALRVKVKELDFKSSNKDRTIGYQGERFNSGNIEVDCKQINVIKKSKLFYYRKLYLEDSKKEVIIKINGDAIIEVNNDNFKLDFVM